MAQTYQVNGNAVDHGGGLVRMTSSTPVPPGSWQTSSAWCTTPHNLTQPFDMTFDLFFGCESGPNGGDGITFTFQNMGLNALGGGGGFLGIGGGPVISPSISIEFDTYDGTPDGGLNEIPQDHIAIDINGDVNNTGNVFVGPGGPVTVQPILGGRDLEDCAQNSNNFYTIRVVWDPAAQALMLYEEGILSLTYTNDIINTIFGGNSQVYWGFTAATGAASNEQWIAPQGAIIPWECATNSCCAPFSLTPTGPSLVCNTPITIGVTGTYAQYQWSTGDNGATIDVSTPGTYTLNVFQNQAGSTCPGTYTFNIGTTGATAVLSGGATLCNDGSTTPLSVTLTGTPPWSISYAIDGVTQPMITGINSSPYIINGESPHTYTLVAVSDNSGCNGSVSGTAVVDAYPLLPIGHDNTFLAPGSTTLTVDDEGGIYEWYTDPVGGTLVHTGTIYDTPILGGTTTYYVQNTAIPAYTSKSVGLLNHHAINGSTVPPVNSGGNNTNIALGLPSAVLWLNFTAHDNFDFESVDLQVNITAAPQAPGSNVLLFLDNLTNGALSQTVTIPVSGLSLGIHTLTAVLNHSIISGHNYRIRYEGTGSVQGILYWNLLGSDIEPRVPITKDPELTISNGTEQPGRYPGIFNWQISVGSPASSCGRTPVTAIHDTSLPVSLLSFTATLQTSGIVSLNWSTASETNNHYFTVQRSSDGIHFIDIAQVQGAGNSTSVIDYQRYDYDPLQGVSYYRIKQTDFDGTYTYSHIERINLNRHDGISFSISPNPSPQGGSIYFDVNGLAPNEHVNVTIYDVLGRLLYTDVLISNENGSIHEVLSTRLSLQSGSYMLSLIPAYKQVYVQKFIVF